MTARTARAAGIDPFSGADARRKDGMRGFIGRAKGKGAFSGREDRLAARREPGPRDRGGAFRTARTRTPGMARRAAHSTATADARTRRLSAPLAAQPGASPLSTRAAEEDGARDLLRSAAYRAAAAMGANGAEGSTAADSSASTVARAGTGAASTIRSVRERALYGTLQGPARPSTASVRLAPGRVPLSVSSAYLIAVMDEDEGGRVASDALSAASTANSASFRLRVARERLLVDEARLGDRVAVAAADAVVKAGAALASALGGALAAAAAALLPVAVPLVVAVAFISLFSSTGTQNLGNVEGTVYAYLRDQGLDDLHCAAIMGNFCYESGGTSDFTINSAADELGEHPDNQGALARGSSGGAALGIAQWDSGRRLALVEFAESKGTQWSDLETQLEFWSDHDEWPDGWSDTTGRYDRAAFDAATDLDDAVKVYALGWERCASSKGVPSGWEKRKEAAVHFYEAITSGSISAAPAGADEIVKAAYSQLGVPYVYGGSSPGTALDCSGLTQYCYAQAGISIRHGSQWQKEDCLAAGGSVLPTSEAQPGDIIWWSGTQGLGAGAGSGHVAIYIGDGKIIEEPAPGKVCRISSLAGRKAAYALRWP